MANKVKQDIIKLSSAIGQLSNPNLLINGNFQIWQRGTSFNVNSTQIVYTADRWCVNTDASALVTKDTSGGLKITSNSVGTFTNVIQKLEDDFVSKIIGKKVALTVEFESGIELINAIGFTDILNTNNIFSNVKNGNKMSLTFTPTVANKNYLYIQMTPNISNQGRSFVVKSVKLELGEIATPLSPRSYGEELALCQRYYTKINYNNKETIGTVNASNTWLNLMISTGTELRMSTPTVDITCSPTRSDNNTVFPPFTNISTRGGTANLGFAYTGTPTNCYSYANQQGYISLDAEIY